MILDSSIIISIYSGKDVELPDDISLPAIVKYELLRGILASKIRHGSITEKERKLLDFLEASNCLDMNEYVSFISADIWSSLKRKGITLDDADIIVAATAVYHKETLMSSDRHFARIKSVCPELDLVLR